MQLYVEADSDHVEDAQLDGHCLSAVDRVNALIRQINLNPIAHLQGNHLVVLHIVVAAPLHPIRPEQLCSRLCRLRPFAHGTILSREPLTLDNPAPRAAPILQFDRSQPLLRPRPISNGDCWQLCVVVYIAWQHIAWQSVQYHVSLGESL